VEVIQRGDELACRQVAARTEDDNRARLVGLAAVLQAGQGNRFSRIHHGNVVARMTWKMVARPGIEPGTHGFSIRCSTN
jgi:hypothetical protein